VDLKFPHSLLQPLHIHDRKEFNLRIKSHEQWLLDRREVTVGFQIEHDDSAAHPVLWTRTRIPASAPWRFPQQRLLQRARNLRFIARVEKELELHQSPH
jgi:hypothetical protein